MPVEHPLVGSGAMILHAATIPHAEMIFHAAMISRGAMTHPPGVTVSVAAHSAPTIAEPAKSRSGSR